MKFLKNFASKRISIITKSIKFTPESNETGLQNFVFEGYLLDEDDEFLYISHQVQGIDSSVRKDDISIVICSETQEMVDAFGDMDSEVVQ
jgi:hypothetical protein